MKKILMASAAVLLLASVPAKAEVTTDQIVVMCGPQDDMSVRSFCFGYLAASIDLLNNAGVSCTAPRKYPEVMAHIEVWLQRQTDNEKHAAMSSVTEAIRELYPCPKGPTY